MKVVLLTQDDPFYLGKNLDYLLSKMPSHSEIVGCVIFDVSPFGKKETFLEKAFKTVRVFGCLFFVRYAIKFVYNKLFSKYKVRKVLQRNDIPIIEIDESINSERSLEKLMFYKPDLLVSVAGNQIFKKPLIELAPKGCLNLHSALLPKYRGLLPSFWVMRFNEEKTGVSVFFVDEGIDSGPIIVQEEMVIGNLTQSQLIEKTKIMGMDAIVKAICKIEMNDIDLIDNPDSESTYFTFPTRQDVSAFRLAGKKFY